MKLNEYFDRLPQNYLFATVAAKQRAYLAAHPGADVLSLGIGDVTEPLPETVVSAMKRAADEMGDARTFRGYPPYEGYDFLRKKIAEYYRARGTSRGADEIFVSDGAKSDLSDLTDLFSADNDVLVAEPVYPVYVDTNILNGRRIRLLSGTEENGFLPGPPDFGADIAYLCSPNNPTGAVYGRAQLAEWVNWANRHGAILLFDAAYEAYISQSDAPHSIYEIPGAETCAIEICSLSKTAGFTGVRCGWTVVPEALERSGKKLRDLWFRRQSASFNGVSYVVQRGAEAVFSPEGQDAVRKAVGYYRENARVIAGALAHMGIRYFGGQDSPYLWLKCPGTRSSWEFFDRLLETCQVVGTPGAGFGASGEGYFRLTAFGSRARVCEAAGRLERLKI